MNLREFLDTASGQNFLHRRLNPTDCDCEHIHASHPSCRSKEVSRGAVREEERLFPAAMTDTALRDRGSR